MMKRFAVLTVIALMLGAAPAVFAQGGGGGGGGGGGSSGGSSGGSTGGSSGTGGMGSGSGTGGTESGGTNPGLGAQPAAPGSGTLQNSPSPSLNQTTPGQTTPGTTGRTAGPIDNTAQAASALQSRGYSNVQGLVRTGDVFRGRAVRDGRTVMIEMDARTGAVREIRG